MPASDRFCVAPALVAAMNGIISQIWYENP
jgi:hypothetical protein